MGLGAKEGELSHFLKKLTEREDPREAYKALHHRIRAIRAEGRQVPEELVRVERDLARECYAQSQGR
jgi:hypothetical protein